MNAVPSHVIQGVVVVAMARLRRLVGVRAFCGTAIHRGADLLTGVESIWCCLDAVTLRPVELPRRFVDYFPAHV